MYSLFIYGNKKAPRENRGFTAFTVALCALIVTVVLLFYQCSTSYQTCPRIRLPAFLDSGSSRTP